MGRPVILGNGSLTVGLNEQGLVHDFYYPYVGLENLTTARSVHHKIGVWCDGQFSWVDDGSWQISVDFSHQALVSKITMNNEHMQIAVVSEDFVDSELNAFCRQIHVTNNADSPRNIRIFMHQVFEISRGGRGDTALFVPEENYILDYKGRCSLLVYGKTSEGHTFDQFAVGNYGIEGKEGTFKDAEDGELSGSAVEHGGVDSVIRFNLTLATKQTSSVDYWVVAADSQYNAEKVHERIKVDGLHARHQKTESFWHEWLEPVNSLTDSVPSEYIEQISKSLMVIKAHTDKRGGIIASCDSSIYNYGRDYYSYVWPRDGAYVMWPLIRMGYTKEPKKFFEFCRDILTSDGYLMHKYQPDKAIGSTWHPLLHGRRKELAIQEDETAIVVFMLGEFFKYTQDQDFIRDLYATFVQPATNFMQNFIDDQTKLPHASYDLWEEKFLTNTYTTYLVYQALLVASELAQILEHPDDASSWETTAEHVAQGLQAFYDSERQMLRKGYLLQQDGSIQFDNTLDVSSMYGAMMFGRGTKPDQYIHATVKAVETTLLDVSPSNGTARYENDGYFKSNPAYQGNPWFVTTLWMAQYYVRAGQAEKAKRYIDWAMEHRLPSGVMAEQINPTNGDQLSVAPLAWSHAEFINTILDYYHKDIKAQADS